MSVENLPPHFGIAMKKITTLVCACLALGMLQAQLNLVEDLRPGSVNALANPLSGKTAVVGETLLFPATASNTFRELHISDGTAEGTFALPDRDGRPVDTPNEMASTGEVAVFRAIDGASFVLWRSDGTSNGTYAISDVRMDGVLCIEAAGDKVFVNATSDLESTNLWVSDGTEAGTSPLTNANGDPILFACEFTLVNGLVYFVGEQEGSGLELWVTDGTSAGTRMIVDITEDDGDAGIDWIENVNGKVLFNATGELGNELWESDGTVSGTRRLRDIKTGSLGSNPMALYNDGDLIFVADDGINGDELWITDGTFDGTKLFADFTPGEDGTFISFFSKFGDEYIGHFDADNVGFELYTMDADKNFSLVKDIVDGFGGIFFTQEVLKHNRMFFPANDNMSGQELWQTDGTTEGTFVNDIMPGGADSDPEILGENTDGFFIGARDPSAGRELFYYNTLTSSLANLSNPVELTVFPNPARSDLQVKTDERMNAGRLISQSGHLMGSFTAQQLQGAINVASLHPGTYFMLIETDKGVGVAPFTKVR